MTSLQKPTIASPKQLRRNTTAAAIDKLMQTDPFFTAITPLPSLSWPYGDILAEMAEFDILTAQNKYKDVAQKSFLPSLKEWKPDPHSRIRNGFVYGYAALRSYLAYRDDNFLKVAQTIWDDGAAYMVSESDVEAGKSPVKNTQIDSVCPDGGTLVGGVFYARTDPEDALITAGATGDFLILSVSLAVATSNQTYLEFAHKSADFIQRHLYRGNGLFWNILRPQNCTTEKSFPYETGSVVHGMSILASLSQNTTIMNFAREAVVGATSSKDWHDSTYIMNLGGDNGEPRVHLMRGYTALYNGSVTPTDLKSYLESYISTQYNAVVELATSGGSNVYGQAYDGPSNAEFNGNAQTAAIGALLGGVLLGGNETSPTTSPSPTTPPTTESNGSSSRSTPVGAIVGGVIGGLAGIALILALGLLYLRRKRAATHEDPPKLTPWTPPAQAYVSSPARNEENTPNAEHFLDSKSQLSPQRLVTFPPQSTLGPTTVSDYTESPSGPSNSPGIASATTDQLVTELSRRMPIDGQWDPDESPPDYQSEAGRGRAGRR
ncbi:hypothetical protein PQX77_014099 [Marasmius sp. AFHP31]|nr:hypothetical protein PQX77_014099 [Marasmius sp. AFHP31]